MKDRIKEIRKTLGYTQSEFAQKLEVAPTAISAWECGRQDVPPSRVFQICSTFHVRRIWLENGIGDMFGSSAPRLTKIDAFIDIGVTIVKSLPERERKIVVQLAEHIVKSFSGN